MTFHWILASAAGVAALLYTDAPTHSHTECYNGDVQMCQVAGASQAEHNMLHAPHVRHSVSPDSLEAIRAAYDSVVLSMLGPTFTYGMDTSVSPCDDEFQFVNGAWRRNAKLPETEIRGYNMVTFFVYAFQKMLQQTEGMLDSSRQIFATTEDPTLRALGTFYESCMTTDTLEPNYVKMRMQKEDYRDSTRVEQCRQRTMQHLSPAVGQAFADDLKKSGAVARMEQLLEAIRQAVKVRLQQNVYMTDVEKATAIDHLSKLVLRVGIPEHPIDYASLSLSPSDYYGNKIAIANFQNTRWVRSLGENRREQWKASLLLPNAMYIPRDHAIEIPTLMFSPPFFFRDGDDLLNFAGVGHIMAHEIFHSLAAQLPFIKDPRLAKDIERFKAFNTSMGTLDDWTANGERTYNEDIADLGGSRAAYHAWKTTIAKDPNYVPDTIDGYTPDQRFFIAMGRIWRSKWTKEGVPPDVHAPNFARVNAVAMQNPEFRQAFGCTEGDTMYLPDDKLSKIW